MGDEFPSIGSSVCCLEMAIPTGSNKLPTRYTTAQYGELFIYKFGLSERYFYNLSVAGA